MCVAVRGWAVFVCLGVLRHIARTLILSIGETRYHMSELEALTLKLEARGHRMTPSRRAVMATVLQQSDHFTAEDLVRWCRRSGGLAGECVFLAGSETQSQCWVGRGGGSCAGRGLRRE